MITSFALSDLMNKYHPDIVRAAKTHEASNKILHQMLQSLEHDKEEGKPLFSNVLS